MSALAGWFMSNVSDLLNDWRSAYGQWVLCELELRQARQRHRGSRTVALLERKVRAMEQECQALQDALSSNLAQSPMRQPATTEHVTA
jgi:hypothetical protein